MVIGITGYKNVGKDLAAKYLVDEYGYTRIAFADKVKLAVARLLDIDVVDIDFFFKNQDIPLLRTRFGRDFTTRELLQRMGTEVGREIFWEDFWVDLVRHRVDPNDKVVFSDVRFMNEAIAIWGLGGEVVQITRPGYGPSEHASEQIDFDVDTTLFNNGTPEDLYDKIDRWLTSHGR